MASRSRLCGSSKYQHKRFLGISLGSDSYFRRRSFLESFLVTASTYFDRLLKVGALLSHLGEPTAVLTVSNARALLPITAPWAFGCEELPSCIVESLDDT
ncbi:hypothetical protein NEOLEDRAFT_1128748 [Neolentinus lepideus HHB14362 ss-1]|uniref:Uncharacterized protein n=1 Tax=Neolentinus lepideus HHB14362 ss-1 TaxID=1314782 RepID=A0A165V4Y3_9AGAM|nr:hypothetical protein NEOLEDRAFT_1128748 [Neolentinus lepideus HHB14362 ss-1]